jgi:hypothetical protein
MLGQQAYYEIGVDSLPSKYHCFEKHRTISKNMEHYTDKFTI